MKVIDASVAVRWFVQNELGRESALTILDEIKNNPAGFAVPDFFFLEMANVLSRLARSSEDLKAYIRGLFDLGFVQVRLGSRLLARAAEIAFKYKVSGYDALYVAVAESLEGKWITGDEKAHAKLKSMNHSVLV